jgi:glycosyltransferase involved in cell wall biosynthesis
MTVAFLMYRDCSRLGGSYSVCRTLGHALIDRGVDVRFVFAYGERGEIGAQFPERAFYIRAKGSRDIAAWLRFRSLIEIIAPAILHFMNVVNWMNLACLQCGGSRVYHVHGPLDPKKSKAFDRWLWWAVAKQASKAIFVSHDLQSKVISSKWFDLKQCVVVNNAIVTQDGHTKGDEAAARQRFGIPRASTVLGHVARQVPEKGGSDAVRLLRYLPEDYYLILTGDGPEVTNLQAEATGVGVANRVRFTGWIQDPTEIYRSLDFLLFLSWVEPFGLVFGEGMAQGVPIVGLNGRGGYREGDRPLIHESASLLLDRLGHSDYPASEATLRRLAEGIVGLRQRPEVAVAMGRFGAAWVREHFSADAQARRVIKVYDEVLGER